VIYSIVAFHMSLVIVLLTLLLLFTSHAHLLCSASWQHVSVNIN